MWWFARLQADRQEALTLIDEKVKKLAQQDNFGTITTLLRDGTPSTHVMWVDADDEYMLNLKIAPGRQRA